MTKVTLTKKEIIASFDIDAQNCFTPLCPDELPVPHGTEIVEELNRQARFADYRIGSKDAHSPHAIWLADDDHPQLSPISGKNVDVRWRSHAIPGTKGFELIKGLPHPIDYDYFVWKGVEPDLHPYGACYHDLANSRSTGVIEFLQARQVTTIIAGGLATDYCVKTTVLQLLAAKFNVIVNLAACRGLNHDSSEAAKAEMVKRGAILIDNSQAIETEKKN